MQQDRLFGHPFVVHKGSVAAVEIAHHDLVLGRDDDAVPAADRVALRARWQPSSRPITHFGAGILTSLPAFDPCRIFNSTCILQLLPALNRAAPIKDLQTYDDECCTTNVLPGM